MNFEGIMKQERGVVSLLTTVIVGLLLSIIVVGMVSLMVGELRQATDSDQSIRAYFAAEAGLEDALLTIENAVASGNPVIEHTSCGAAVPVGPAGTDAKYTCQLVTINKLELAGRRNKEEAVQLEPSTSFTKLRVRWHQKGSDPDLPNPYSTPGGFTQGSSWNNPAALELTALSFPSTIQSATNGIGAGGVEVRTAVLYPAAAAYPASAAMPTPPTALKLDGSCSLNNVAKTGGYYCEITVTGITAQVVRIRPRYAGANYSIQFLDSADAPVRTIDQTATVDVTARAGDVYRRVQVGVPLKAGLATGLDYVLFSDSDLCKDFGVSGGKAAGNPGCSGL